MILYIHSNSFSQKLIIDTKCYIYNYRYFQYSKLENFCIFVISNNKSFISKNMKFVGPLVGKLNLFSPSEFEIQSDLDYRTSKSKFYSIRALKCYLNEKHLIQGRVTATISKFSWQVFETYFDLIMLFKIIITILCAIKEMSSSGQIRMLLFVWQCFPFDNFPPHKATLQGSNEKKAVASAFH